MPELRFISRNGIGRVAEIEAYMFFPNEDDHSKRMEFLSNYLKKFYINCLHELIHIPKNARPDDAERAILDSVYGFDEELYQNLGGINSIMNSISTTIFDENKVNNEHRLIGTCFFLMYCYKHNEKLFNGYDLSSQGKTLDIICLAKFGKIFDIQIAAKTIETYIIYYKSSIHLIVGHFVYDEMCRILADVLPYNMDPEAQSFLQHLKQNKYQYIVGYSKAFYDWGSDKKNNQRRPILIIDKSVAFSFPNEITAIDLPIQLVNFYAGLVTQIPMRLPSKTI